MYTGENKINFSVYVVYFAVSGKCLGINRWLVFSSVKIHSHNKTFSLSLSLRQAELAQIHTLNRGSTSCYNKKFSSSLSVALCASGFGLRKTNIIKWNVKGHRKTPRPQLLTGFPFSLWSGCHAIDKRWFT